MPSSCIAERLGDVVNLTAAEHVALDRLEEREKALRRGAILLRENDVTNELFVLKCGTMMSFVILADGRCQILRFLSPGDTIGFPALAYARAQETTCALTDCIVCPFERGALARLIADHPRLAATLLALSQIERATLTDRLVGIGRTSAKVRIASLLLEIRDHMRRADRESGDSFALGLTQEEIGDATGLTAVHVNRMLRQLEEEKLIARANGRVTLLDQARLARAANCRSLGGAGPGLATGGALNRAHTVRMTTPFPACIAADAGSVGRNRSLGPPWSRPLRS